jgi:peptidoglycan hydrolase CwlO-like protein
MKLLITFLLLTASVFAATSSSDRMRLDKIEQTLALQENANAFNLQLHNTSTKTDENQNDAIAELQEKVTKLEKQIKILEKRIK